MYINSDDDIIALGAKISYLEITIKFIDGVIKSIDNRGWDVKSAIGWKKFEAGMVVNQDTMIHHTNINKSFYCS